MRKSQKSKGAKRCRIQSNSPQGLTGICQAAEALPTTDQPGPPLPAPRGDSVPAASPRSPRPVRQQVGPYPRCGGRAPPATCPGPASGSAQQVPARLLGAWALRFLPASSPPSEETSLSRGTSWLLGCQRSSSQPTKGHRDTSSGNSERRAAKERKHLYDCLFASLHLGQLI